MSAQAIKHRVKEKTTNKVFSKIETGNWSKTFPPQLQTLESSLQFVKKLVAISVSNIMYIRGIFPEKAFQTLDLDGLKFKLLLEKPGNEQSEMMVNIMKGLFDAIERQYLREFHLLVHLDPEDADTIAEMYTFTFSYSEGEVAMDFSINEKCPYENKLYKTATSLIRTIILLTQGFEELPDQAYLTAKLTYYDEITPPEYEPPGFAPTTPIKFSPDYSVTKNVETQHHSVTCKIVQPVSRNIGNGTEFVGDSFADDTPSPSLSFQPQNGKTDKLSPYSPTSCSTQAMSLLTDDDGDTPTLAEPSQPPQITASSCICGLDVIGVSVLQCGGCEKLSHASCYMILLRCSPDKKLTCLDCLKGVDSDCEMQELMHVIGKQRAREKYSLLCVLRMALEILLDRGEIQEGDMSNIFRHVDTFSEEHLLEKLIQDGYLSRNAGDNSGSFSADKERIISYGVEKFFTVKKKRVTEKTESNSQVGTIDSPPAPPAISDASKSTGKGKRRFFSQKNNFLKPALSPNAPTGKGGAEVLKSKRLRRN